MAKLNAQKLKISPTKIILSLNLMKITKYGLAPEEIEWRSLAGECFKTIFNMHKSEKIEKHHCRQDAYDVKKYSAKRKKLDTSVKKFLFLLRELERKLLQGDSINSLYRILVISSKQDIYHKENSTD